MHYFIKNISTGVSGLAILMIFTSSLAIVEYNKFVAAAFFIPAIFTLVIAIVLFLAVGDRKTLRTKISDFMLVPVFWIVFGFVGGLPFYFSGNLSLINATFESISALTTNGSSVWNNAFDADRIFIYWRIILQFVGIILFFSTTMFFIPISTGRSNRFFNYSPLFALDFFKFDHRWAIVANIIFYYVILVLLGTLLITAFGSDLSYSFGLSIAAVTTGGFLPSALPIGLQVNYASQQIISLLMIIGSLNLVVHIGLTNNSKDKIQYFPENLWVINSILILFITSIFFVSDKNNIISYIPELIFNSIAIISTSGLLLHSDDALRMPFEAILPFILIGGATFSTTGGFKISRIKLLIYRSILEFKKLINPKAILHFQINNIKFPEGAASITWIHCFMIFIAITVVSLFLSMQYPTYMQAFFVSIAHVSGVGNIADLPWDGQIVQFRVSELYDSMKILLISLMIFGRVEFLVLLVAAYLSINYYKNS